MDLLAGRATIEDLDDFVARIGAIGDEHGAIVQAFDPRYVVDRDHLERAVALADRAIERDEAIADDRAMEILCYAAGTRQIREALTIGVSRGESVPVLVLIDGGDESGAREGIEPLLDETGEGSGGSVGDYDEGAVRAFFEISDAELAATDAGIPALVRERVALLVVER